MLKGFPIDDTGKDQACVKREENAEKGQKRKNGKVGGSHTFRIL